MIKFNLIGEHTYSFPVEKYLKKLLKQVQKTEDLQTKHVISFILVDSPTIQTINRDYRGIDQPTDVISFANIDSCQDGEIPYELGDVFINNDRVFSQAEEYGHSVLREFMFLALHGTLHLLGYDHLVEEEATEMFSKQEEILHAINVERKLTNEER